MTGARKPSKVVTLDDGIEVAAVRLNPEHRRAYGRLYAVTVDGEQVETLRQLGGSSWTWDAHSAASGGLEYVAAGLDDRMIVAAAREGIEARRVALAEAVLVSPTITTEVVEGVVLPRETHARQATTHGTEIRIFANGELVGTVEVPAKPEAWELELVATPVTVKSGDGWAPARCRFPNGGTHERTPSEVARIERAHSVTDARLRIAGRHATPKVVGR
jgi:hypothetical protein